MKRLKKILLRIVLPFFLILIFVISAGMLWINSNSGKTWVEDKVNALIPGSIAIGRQHLSLFSPALGLDNVTIKDANGKTLAGFSRFSIQLAFFPLLKREVRITDLTLDDPWADLVMDDAGLTIVRALVEPSGDNDTSAEPQEVPGGEFSLPVNIVCQRLYIGKGRVFFDMPEENLHVAATGLVITGDADVGAQKARLTFQMDAVDVKRADISPHPIRIDLNAGLDGKQFTVSTLSITTGKTQLSFSATADAAKSSNPTLDGRLTLESDLAELADVLSLGKGYAGALNTALSIKGPIGNPSANLSADITAGQISGWKTDKVNLEIHLEDRKIAVNPVEWKLADGRVRLNGAMNLKDAFPSGFLSPDRNLDSTAYNLTLDAILPRIRPWLEPVIAMDGHLETHLSLSGKGVSPDTADAELSLEVNGKKILAPGMKHPLETATLSLIARLGEGRLTLSGLDAVTDDFSLSGNGHFQLSDQVLFATLGIHTDDISRTLAMAGLPSATGSVHAALSAAGSLARPDASLKMTVRGLGMDAYTVGDLDLSAAMKPDGTMNLERLQVVNKDSRIDGSGRFRLRLDKGDMDPDFNTALDLDLSTVSLHPFIQTPPVDGIIDGKLRISGPLTDLSGDLTLTGKHLKKEALAIGDLTAGLRLGKGMLYTDRLNLKNGDATIAIAGKSQILVPGIVQLKKDPSLDLSVRASQFDPTVLIPTVKGLFNLDATITGSVSDPKGKLTVKGTGLDVAGQPLSGIHLEARVKEKQVLLDALKISVTPDEVISADGWMGLNQQFEAHLETTGISLERLKFLAAHVPAKGVLTLDVRASGSLGAPSADGYLALSGIHVNDRAMKDVRLDLSLHDQVARINGDLNFLLDAQYALDKGDFGATLQFDRTDTGPWFEILGKSEINGAFSGKITASGNTGRPEDASVQVDLRDLALFFMKRPLVSADRIALQLSNQTLSIPEMNFSLLSTGHLKLSGTATMGSDPADGKVNASIDANLPLSAMRLFSTVLSDARGALVLEGTVSGSLNQPSVNARLNIDQITMTVPVLEQKLHGLTGNIQMTDSAIVVDGVRGGLDTGSFEINGQIRHTAFAPTDINLILGTKALPIEVPDTLSALINTDIQVIGKDRAATVLGSVVLLEGSYYKDMNLNFLKMATTRHRAVSPASAPIHIPYLDTVVLNVGINYRQPFLVENNLASMEINPDIKIGGTLATPVVSGRAQITNGTVYFQRKPFAIKKGIIDFVNPYKTVPEINIESTTVIRERTITLTLEGPPENLKLKLSSVPEETDSDILSLIIFGRTARELTSGTGGAQQTTAQMMAGMVADTFGDDIKKHTGIDILQVDADGGSDAETDIKVTVGKHLSRRMTVKYAVESKNAAVTQRAIAEYKLLENFLLSGFQDTEGVYGTELVFRVEFR